MQLFAEGYQLWERQFAIEGGLRSAEFAGLNDEFIVAYDDHHLYKFNTETSQMLDSIYYEKVVISSVISNDGLKYYINVEDNIIVIDVNTMNVNDTIPTPELSGNIINKGLSQRTTQINISNNDRFITYSYAESNLNSEHSYEFIVYDLIQRKIIARVGDNERNYRSFFYNPTFTPNAETLLVVVYRPENNFQESERQLWFYDIKNGTSINIGDKEKFRNKLQTNSGSNSDFTFIEDKKVHITNSTLPDLYGFNVLNLETGTTESYFNFEGIKHNVYTGRLNKINEYLFIVPSYSFIKKLTKLVFFDISIKDTLFIFNIQNLRAMKINVNKDNTLLLGYNSYQLELYDLSELLITASVKPFNLFSEIKLSPNPSQNREFNLIVNSVSNMNINLSIYNIIGQKSIDIRNNIFINEGENQIEFNLPNELPAGQYFLRIETERGNQDVKIQL